MDLGHLRCHQETNGTSNAQTPVNRTITVAARVFHKFVPGAPFHPPIPHSTAAPPTSVTHLHTNSLSKSPDPWGSLALHHVRCTCQQNLSFCTPIYTILVHQSKFALIASALALAQSTPSWVFSCFSLVGVMMALPCGSGDLC